MDIQERDALKGYFQTGKYPTEQQFAALIDSFVHKTDSVPMQLVEGLASVLNGKANKSVETTLAEILKKIEDGELGGMTLDEQAALQKLQQMFSVDEAKSWLRIQDNNKRYFVALTELSAPNAPSVAVTMYREVTGSASVAVTNNTSGATMQYSQDGGKTWNNTTGTISIASGYENTKTNKEITHSLWLKAVKNGEESEINKVTITIKPKVASGGVAVAKNNNNNDYSTSATITLSPSPTVGAISYYSIDGGITWIEFSAQTTKTTNSSQSAGVFQVKAVASESLKVYEDATTVKSSAFTLNAKKAFYGFSTSASLSGVEEIQALASTGGSVENTVLSGSLEVKPSGSAAGYIWLCCVGTLRKDNIVPNRGDVIPFGFEAASKVDGYNCYRSTNAINPVNTNVYIP